MGATQHGSTSLLLLELYMWCYGNKRSFNNTMKTFILNKDVTNIRF